MTDKAEQILAGLGGAANVVEIEACITRLRTEVEDPSKVDDGALKRAGAHGVDSCRKDLGTVRGNGEPDGCTDSERTRHCLRGIHVQPQLRRVRYDHEGRAGFDHSARDRRAGQHDTGER